MSDVHSKFDWWLWADNAEDALKDAGGILTIRQACDLLDMPLAEVRARLDERSILFFEVPEMYGEGEIIIPAFQFHGKFHIPGFHDIWDVLEGGCKVERICQFFCLETFAKTGVCVADVLRGNPDDLVMSTILEQAGVFKTWCMENTGENDEYEQEEGQDSDEGQDAQGRKASVTPKTLFSVCLGILWFVLISMVGGLLFPFMAVMAFRNRTWLVLTDVLISAFIGSGVAFVLYALWFMAWWASWI